MLKSESRFRLHIIAALSIYIVHQPHPRSISPARSAATSAHVQRERGSDGPNENTRARTLHTDKYVALIQLLDPGDDDNDSSSSEDSEVDNNDDFDV